MIFNSGAGGGAGGLRIIRQGTYTITGPVNLTLDSQPLFGIVSVLDEEAIDQTASMTVVLAYGDDTWQVITSGGRNATVKFTESSSGSYRIRIAVTGTAVEIPIQYTVFG